MPYKYEYFKQQFNQVYKGGFFDTKLVYNYLERFQSICKNSQLESLFEGLEAKTDLKMHPDFEQKEYHAHNSGYDSFMTAAVFLKLSNQMEP